jgi:hypothetical protein
MTDTQYTVTAYVLGMGLLLGYALNLWRAHRALRRRGDVAGPG